MQVNSEYLTKSKQQVLQVFWAVLNGGIAGRSFGDLAKELNLSESALLKDLHNLAAVRYVERKTNAQFWGVSTDFIEQFAQVIESLGLKVK